MQKIRWTKSEREVVYREAVSHMIGITFEKGELAQLLRSAQNKVLPQGRRREPNSILRNSAHRNQVVAQLRTYYEEKKRGQEPDRVRQADASGTTSTGAAPDLNQQVAAIGAVLAEHLLAAVEQVLRNGLAGVLSKVTEEAKKELTVAVNTPPEKKPAGTVLVVGTNSVEQQTLMKDYDSMLKLKFFDNPNGSSGLDQACRFADRVLLNGSRCRHFHQSVVRASGRPMVITHGSLGAIKRALDTIYFDLSGGAR